MAVALAEALAVALTVAEALAMALAVAMAMALALAMAIWKVEKSENFQNSKVLRMGMPIMKNLSGPRAIIFSLFKLSQLCFNLKS